MERSARAFIPIVLLVLAGPALAGEDPPSLLYRFTQSGALRPERLRTLREIETPEVWDMALGFGGDLLLLTPEGELRLIAAGDSLVQAFWSGDLGAEHWPEAVAADGPDWLLLVRGGQALLRLGRRGEVKEEVPLPDHALWRGLRADRAGRIWVAEERGGRFLVLSRSGQLLLRWNIEDRIPGFRGPLRAWCPDQQGGILVLEGWPARIHHLNGAGNPLGHWAADLPAGELAMAVDGSGDLRLASGPEGEEPHLLLYDLPRRIFLKQGSRIRVLEPEPAVGGKP